MKKQTFNPQSDRIIGNLIPDWGDVLENTNNYDTVTVVMEYTTDNISYKGSSRQIIKLSA